MQLRTEDDLPHHSGVGRPRAAFEPVRRLAFASAIVAAVAGSVSALYFPLSPRVIDVARGEVLFRERCVSCHGLDRSAVPKYGPSLHRIGALAGARVPGIGAEEYILTSIVRPDAYRSEGTVGEMPKTIALGLSRDDLLGLTAFLCSQGGRYRTSKLLHLVDDVVPTPDEGESGRSLDLASVERGRQLFSGELKCSDCHSLETYVGSDLLAPSLREAGRHDRAYLKDAILHAGRQIAPGYEMWQVVWEGMPYAGRRLPSPVGTVTLLSRDERGDLEVRSLPEGELEPLDEEGQSAMKLDASLMPSFEAAISGADLEALLDYLSTLR